MGNRRGANRIKATRDATSIEKNPQGVPVNRTEAIAWLGGAANNNEDCYREYVKAYTTALTLINPAYKGRA